MIQVRRYEIVDLFYGFCRATHPTSKVVGCNLTDNFYGI